MSTIYRDFLSPARARWSSNYAAYNSFKKAWGTTTIDGIEVFNKTLIYWQGGMVLNTAQKRFIKRIGLSYEQLAKQEYKGISNAYFKLNASKYTYEPMDTAAIAEDLSNAFAVGDEFEVAVTYGGDLKRYVSTFIQPDGTGGYKVDTVAIRAMLNSDRVKYFANAKPEAAGSMFQETEDSVYNIAVNTNRTAISTPVTKLAFNDSDTGNGKLYDCLAMLDNGTTFQEIEINTERVTAVDTKDQYGNVAVVGEYSYIVKFRVIANPLVSSYITTQCSTVAHAMKDSMLYTRGMQLNITNHSQDTLIKQAVLLMSNPSSHPAFYNGYLRVDYCAGIKRKDFIKILGNIFDSGYTKKKTKWYEKVIAIVIIIVAIVITFFFGPMVGALFLNIATYLYAQAFPHATDMVRLMGHAATALAIAGIYTAWADAPIQASIMAAALAAQFSGMDQKWVILLQTLAVVAGSYEHSFKEGARLSAESAAKEAGATASEIAEAGRNAFSSASFSLTDAVHALTELPGQALDRLSNINIGSSLTNISDITLGDISGWVRNLDTGMKLYTSFFVTPYEPPLNSEDQSTKEDGAMNYYAALAMLDRTDALDRVTRMKDEMFGGERTNMFMMSIT